MTRGFQRSIGILLIGAAGFCLMPSGSAAAAESDRADCIGNANNPDQKIAACTRVIDDGAETTANRVIAFNNRGFGYSSKRDYDRAIAEYDEAIKLDPKFAAAFRNRGLAYGAKGDRDRAIAEYDEAIKLNSRFVAAYYNRGFAYAGKQDYDRAIADYSEALNIDPKYILAYQNRGNRLLQQEGVRPRHCGLQRGNSPSIPNTRLPTPAAAGRGCTRANMIAALRTSTRRSSSIRNIPGRGFNSALRIMKNSGSLARATGISLSPPTAR